MRDFSHHIPTTDDHKITGIEGGIEEEAIEERKIEEEHANDGNE